MPVSPFHFDRPFALYQAFEAQDSLMVEELSRRTEVEVRLRQEADKKKAEEKERARWAGGTR